MELVQLSSTLNLGDDGQEQETGEEPDNVDEDDDSSGVSDANQEVNVKAASDNEKQGSTVESMAQITQEPVTKEETKNSKVSKVEPIYPEKDGS